MSNNLSFTISILTFNRKEVVSELLLSLQNLSEKGVEIIVIDNFSEDGTSEMIKNSYKFVKLITLPRNLGVESRNVGIINASGDVVVTIDDDVLGINDKSLQILENMFIKNPDVGAVCFKVLDYYNGKVCNWCHPYAEEEFTDKKFETTEITEGAVAFRKSVLNETGYYPHNYFISHEGADLCARIMNKGYSIIYTPEIMVKHKYAIEGRKNWRRYFYDTRNDYWLVLKNYSFSFCFRYLIKRTFVMMIYSIRDGFFYYWLKAILIVCFELPQIFRERNPISKDAERKIKLINNNKPNILYYIRKRWNLKQVRI